MIMIKASELEEGMILPSVKPVGAKVKSVVEDDGKVIVEVECHVRRNVPEWTVEFGAAEEVMVLTPGSGETDKVQAPEPSPSEKDPARDSERRAAEKDPAK